MARNKDEQIQYLTKRRVSGMSDKEFKEELERLYNIVFDDVLCPEHELRSNQ